MKASQVSKKSLSKNPKENNQKNRQKTPCLKRNQKLLSKRRSQKKVLSMLLKARMNRNKKARQVLKSKLKINPAKMSLNYL